MEKLISFWAAPDWRLLGFIAVILLVVVLGVYWVLKIRAKNKEEKSKKRPSTFAVEHFDKLFRIVKMEKDKSVAFIHFDPTREYSSGKAGAWFSLEKVPGNCKFEGSIIKVIKGPDEKVMIVPVQYNGLPTEKELFELKKAKELALAEAAAKALELAKAKKAT